MTKGKILLGRVIANTLGATHFVAQSTADLLLKVEVESIAKLFDCKDAKVDIALARKHKTRQAQNTVKKVVKEKTEFAVGLTNFSIGKVNRMYN